MTHGAKMWTALVTVYVIWGSTYLGIAYAGETIPPLFAASTRFITAGVLMAGVGIGFAGVALLAQPSGGAKLWGIGLCVVSAVMWSTGSVLAARLTLPADPFAATAYEMLLGGLLMLPFSLLTVHGFSPSATS